MTFLLKSLEVTKLLRTFAARNDTYRAMTVTMLRSRLKNRWNSLKYLDEETKIDLISMLTLSLKKEHKQKSFSASKLYGIWGDDGMSDVEFVEMLKQSTK